MKNTEIFIEKPRSRERTPESFFEEYCYDESTHPLLVKSFYQKDTNLPIMVFLPMGMSPAFYLGDQEIPRIVYVFGNPERVNGGKLDELGSLAFDSPEQAKTWFQKMEEKLQFEEAFEEKFEEIGYEFENLRESLDKQISRLARKTLRSLNEILSKKIN